MEMLLTIEQAALRLQLHRDTVRKQLKRGDLRGVKRGRVWRVPESALEEATPTPATPPQVPTVSTPDAPKSGDVAALFAPSTLEEIARQLDALDKLTGAAPTRAGDVPELDLSDDRGEVYGYTERENRQL